MLFLLSILKSNDSNENLKYLCNTFRFYSWNYDRSFELALNSIIKNEEKQSNDFSKLISYINGSVNMYENSYSHNIKFYWENNASVIEDLPLAHEYVYIGYSFPDYNHSQDMLFLKYCIRNDIKIVIQDIKASNICEKILGIEDIQIELKNKFIPGNPTKDFSKLELKSFFDKIFYAYPACETFYIPKIQESSNYIS